MQITRLLFPMLAVIVLGCSDEAAQKDGTDAHSHTASEPHTHHDGAPSDHEHVETEGNHGHQLDNQVPVTEAFYDDSNESQVLLPKEHSHDHTKEAHTHDDHTHVHPHPTATESHEHTEGEHDDDEHDHDH